MNILFLLFPSAFDDAFLHPPFLSTSSLSRYTYLTRPPLLVSSPIFDLKQPIDGPTTDLLWCALGMDRAALFEDECNFHRYIISSVPNISIASR